MDYRGMTSPNFSRGHPDPALAGEGPRTDAVEILLKEDDQSSACEILLPRLRDQDDRLLRM
jgi:hypothetical protein